MQTKLFYNYMRKIDTMRAQHNIEYPKQVDPQRDRSDSSQQPSNVLQNVPTLETHEGVSVTRANVEVLKEKLTPRFLTPSTIISTRSTSSSTFTNDSVLPFAPPMGTGTAVLAVLTAP